MAAAARRAMPVVHSTTWESPLGTLWLADDGAGICRIGLVRLLDPAGLPEAAPGPLLDQARRELEEYFAGVRRVFEVPVSLYGTPFQQEAWEALRRIPYGETRSYADQARAVGRPKAYRAVGMANNRNPVIVVVPCHRVVGSGGDLVGYAGGVDIKQRLLELEGAR